MSNFYINNSIINDYICINTDMDNEPDLEPIKTILRKRKNKSLLKEESEMTIQFMKHLSNLNIEEITIKKTSDVKQSIELNLKNIFKEINKIYWIRIDDNKYNSIKLSFIDKEEMDNEKDKSISNNSNTIIETIYKESIDNYNYRIILELKNNLFLYIKGIYNKKEESKIIIYISSKYNYLIHYFLNDLEYCYYMQETEYIEN
jgi:hypothetical protein